MRYGLFYASRELAELRSAVAWQDHLGRAPNPSDTTTMMWGVEDTEGGVQLVIPEDTLTLLDANEIEQLALLPD